MRTVPILILLIAACCIPEPLLGAGTGMDRTGRISAIAATSPAHNPAMNLVEGKCGTRLYLFIRDSWERFSAAQQTELRALMAPEDFQKSRIAGHFEIRYDTTGFNAPSMLDAGGNPIPGSVEQYIDSVGRYFNHAWEIEVDSMGYSAPPIANGYYVVIVKDFGAATYGQTVPEGYISGSNPARYLSYIEIDNDFRNFYSAGIAGLRVTAAHEFHHAIQMGRYGVWNQDQGFFMEITSTWLEDVLHTDVNDYYNYIRTPGGFPRGTFLTPELSFVTANGNIEYSRAIWGKYIERRFSPDLMLRTWEEIGNSPVLTAMNKVLSDSGSSLQEAFIEWSRWNYFTGRRANERELYAEGSEYPEIRERDSLQYYSPAGFYTDSVQALASRYRPVVLNRGVGIYTVVSNVNTNPGGFGGWQHYTYRLADVNDGTFKRLDTLVFVKLDVSDPLNWKSQESVPSTEPPPPAGGSIRVYPNPLFLPWSGDLTFVLPYGMAGEARLLIYDAAFRPLFDEMQDIGTDISGFPSVRCRTSAFSLSSGVYFYLIERGGDVYKGKITVLKR